MTPDDQADAAIRDDRDHHRFLLEAGGSVAELVYRVEPGRMILEHTEVPDALGGRGLGGRLVRAAIDRAEAEGLTVVPWCPFARKWLTDHAEAADRVDIDWDTPPPSRS